MREAIGGTWLYGLVLTFIVFFASFLAISINYSKAFNVKNNIVDILSKYEGNNCNSREKISEYLKDVGYLVTGKCDSGYIGYNLNGDFVSSDKAYYCVASDSTASTTALEKSLYRVEIFFKVNLPIIGELTTFKIKGETEYVFFPEDNVYASCS